MSDRWIPVDTVADYFDAAYAEVRDELQQRHLLGDINGVLHATEEQSYLWASRRFGAPIATKNAQRSRAVRFPQ